MFAAMRVWLASVLCCSVACSEGKAPKPEQPEAAVVEAVHEQLAVAAQAPAPVAPDAPSPARSKLKPPARGCVLAQERTLLEPAAQVWMLPAERALVLGVDRRTLTRLTLSEPPAQLARLQHEPKIAKLAVLRGPGENGDVGFVDDKGDVFLLRANADKPERLGQGADRRFAPALTQYGARTLLAFTRTVDEVMHTFVVSPGQPAVDVTPAGHGASAATFVLGAASPVLVAIDARAGVSPLLEIPFDAQGKPQPAVVRTPVSQPYAPPLLGAVQVPGGELEVAFTALGKLAATAVGRVPLRRAVGPVALHPSRGYGELSFDLLRTERAALFAIEVPLGEDAKAPHAIELKWLDAQGDGQTLLLGSADRPARSPSIAAAGGEVTLGYVTQQKAQLARVVCDR